MDHLDRRSFLSALGGVAAGPALASSALAMGSGESGSGAWGSGAMVSRRASGDSHRGPVVIASGNGLRATSRAYELILAGSDPVDAIVAGVNIVEDDPDDMSVGLGGLPNEEGVVQLDASVMHGPTHKAGAVAAIENIRNPASVALLVLKRTDHVLIVGEGAKRFALAHGFKEENLLTERARQVWLDWKHNANPTDDWLNDEESDFPVARRGASAGTTFTYGTINCCAVNAAGDLSSVTTTSGLSYKIPGRVGDSPIIGAGMYCDNKVGAAGATGRGEAVIQNCGAFSIVREMENGLSPTEACLRVMKRIADNTRQKRLLNERGEPNFGVTLYALRKDGAFGSAVMRGQGSFAVTTSEGTRLEPCAALFS